MTSTAGSPHPDDPPRRETSPALRLLVVGVLLALAVSPTAVLVSLLGFGAVPAALGTLAAVFVGPALSAAFFALGEKARDDGLGPAAAFGRGYRLNALDVLTLWVPTLLVLAVVAFTVLDAAAQGASPWVVGLGLGLSVLILLWLVQATAIASFFAFRGRDTARLALYFLGRLPKVTFQVLLAVVLAGLFALLSSVALLALLGVLWVAVVLRCEKPMLAEVRLRFVDAD
ncbi:glycosyltransferase [Isoptericola aurantiacus]|uniref:glycosyltransferase n=1 Tax=Isoptericola aurantiacus TaxID=3377839 RepID=UPI00383ACCDB